MINFTINGIPVQVEEGTTILEAAKQVHIAIPTLCYSPALMAHASCGICVVRVEGSNKMLRACITAIDSNMEGKNIITHDAEIIAVRRTVLELILSNHPNSCLECSRNKNCELQSLAADLGIRESPYRKVLNRAPADKSNPFFDVDRDKCIYCGRCETVCNTLQCADIQCVSGRGFKTRIGPVYNMNMGESSCVSCGNCVSMCPTGALSPKTGASYVNAQKIQTTCAYCGVGCQIYLMVRENRIIGVEPAQGASNKGLLCVKGKFAYNFVGHKDRLAKPLIKKDGKFMEAEWEEALSLIVSKITGIKQQYGSDALAGFSSARVSNEDNYVFQKFFRTAIGTNNIDHCARLCHASTVAGLAITLGSGAMTNTIEEISQQDLIFVTGSNTTEAHPVIGAKIRQAKRNGSTLIVADPRRIELAEEADIFLQLRPGTNIALYNGMLNAILEAGLEDRAFINERCENFDETIAAIREYTPEKAAQICGVAADDIRKAAQLYAAAGKAGIFYSMGVTQFSTGTQGVMALSNLALSAGKIGKEGCGVNPLRGQNNVQGACDMGALPGDFPGYQKVHNPANIEKFKKAWACETLPSQPGLTITGIMNECGKKIKMLYIMGENPMLSDPDINHVKASLDQVDFLVVQDIFMTETAEYADVVLPAASFAEKDGTFTNTERRVQRIRKAVNCAGEAREDWRILSELSQRLGYKNSFNSACEIMDEIASLTPSYGGISYDRLDTMQGLQWPCPDKNHCGTRFLHSRQFAREGGKALFKPVAFSEAKEQPDPEYPFILTTGRILYQYHTRTMSGRNDGLNAICGNSFIEISAHDAEQLGISDGESVKVSSRRGELVSKARIAAARVSDGVVFMPFHFADGAANLLTNPVTDDIAKIPEFKVCACNITRC